MDILWQAKGTFRTIGQVICYYRKLCGLSKDELATNLGYTQRYIEMLESDQNLAMPELISRRILLAKALQIPPALLGLSSLALIDMGRNIVPLAELLAAETTADVRVMAFYEGMLTLGWEFYYTSSVQRAAKTIDLCFEMLNDEAKDTSGIKLDQFDAMRCRFYQLSSVTARDRMEVEEALEQIDQAVEIAMRLRNAELISSSLLRRARIYIQKPDYELALKDAMDALPYADLSRDPLKGKCYQMAGEARAYLAREDKALQDKSITYFDKAGRIARKGNMEPDGSFVKTDLTSIYIERAKALTLFRRFDEAHNAFAVARKKLSPELTRWQVNLLIEEAKTYFAQGEVESCCLSLLDALPIVRAINMQNREGFICRLLEKCKQQDPSVEALKLLEKALAYAVPIAN